MSSYLFIHAIGAICLLLASGVYARPFGLNPATGSEASRQAATLLVTKTPSLARKTGGPRVDIVHVDGAHGEDVNDTISRLLGEEGIESVELDRPANLVEEMIPEREYLPNDPEFLSQWHLPFIRAPQAWAYATGSSDVKVCVVDSGVSGNHPDLQCNLEHFEGDRDFRDSYSDSSGHGTHISGIIAAKGNNGYEVSGINWNANLISCKFLSDADGGLVSNAIVCMNWCAQQGAKIINNSWTTMYAMNALEQTMKDLEKKGVMFVTAAANQGANLDDQPEAYPAAFSLPNQIVVAALNPDGKLADYSNYSPSKVQIAAPGSDVLSLARDGGVMRLSGTSCSAPMVTGTLALMEDASRGEFSMKELKDILLNTYRYDKDLEQRVEGGRVLDTGKAVRVAREEYERKLTQEGRESDIH